MKMKTPNWKIHGLHGCVHPILLLSTMKKRNAYDFDVEHDSKIDMNVSYHKHTNIL